MSLYIEATDNQKFICRRNSTNCQVIFPGLNKFSFFCEAGMAFDTHIIEKSLK